MFLLRYLAKNEIVLVPLYSEALIQKESLQGMFPRWQSGYVLFLKRFFYLAAKVCFLG